MKLKSLAIITLYPPSDTKETFLLNEIAELKSRVDLHLYPLKKQVGGRRLNTVFDLIKLNILFFAKRPIEFVSSLIFIAIKSRGRNFFRNFLYLGQINKIHSSLKAKQVDHIHAYWASSPAFAALLLSRWLNISFSYTAHRYDILENDFLNIKTNKAKFVRSISNWGKEELEKSCATEDRGKLKTIYLSIKIPSRKQIIDTNYETLKIAVIGNYNRRKGHQYLIEALGNLRTKYNAEFYGKGPLKKRLQQLIGQNHLSEKIKIKGFLPHKELLHKLRNHKFNVIILPSLSEGLPAALIEGAAHSILVIGSDRGGTAELIGKKNVFLIKDPTDPKQILKALQSINKLNAKQAIERNYQTIKDNFDAKKCTQRLIDEITAD